MTLTDQSLTLLYHLLPLLLLSLSVLLVYLILTISVYTIVTDTKSSHMLLTHRLMSRTGRISLRTLLTQPGFKVLGTQVVSQSAFKRYQRRSYYNPLTQMLMTGGSRDLVMRMYHSMVQRSLYLNHLPLTQVSYLVSRTLYLVNQIIQQQSQLTYRLLVNSY